MTARGYMAIVALVLAAISTFLTWMFYVQNAARKTQLSFELPMKLAKWQLPEAIPVVWLLGIGFLVGFLLAFLVFVPMVLARNSRVRRLERELAFTAASRPMSPASSGGMSSGSTAGSGSADGWK